MKSKIGIIVSVAAFLFLTGYAQAQTVTAPIKVKIIAETAGLDPDTNLASQNVADVIAGKLGSASRYALVTGTDESISFDVDCLDIKSQGGGHLGYACSSGLTYWPDSTIPFSERLTSNIASGSDVNQVAEDLYDNFIEESSDEALAKKQADFIINVGIIREQAASDPTSPGYKNGYDAGFIAGKASCGTPAKKKPNGPSK